MCAWIDSYYCMQINASHNAFLCWGGTCAFSTKHQPMLYKMNHSTRPVCKSLSFCRLERHPLCPLLIEKGNYIYGAGNRYICSRFTIRNKLFRVLGNVDAVGNAVCDDKCDLSLF